MKKFTSTQAGKEAKILTAKEFEAKFDTQIEVLDQDNLFNANEGDYNIIFRGKDDRDLSISFYNGVLEQVYEMTGV
jgi:hypothetical protein